MFNVLAGDYSDKNTKLLDMFGKYELIIVEGWFGTNIKLKEDVQSIKIVENNDDTSLLKGIGWGLVGGMLAGGLGVIFGAIKGSKDRNYLLEITFTNNKKSLIQVCDYNYKKLLKLNHEKFIRN